VWDGVSNARNAEEALLCFFNSLCNSCWNFLSLTVANANCSVTVSDNYQSGETKAASTLYNLRNTVDCDNALQELALGFFAIATLTLRCTIA